MLLVTHEIYMRRCIELAALGLGHVSPNPMVGAVLVHNNRIIGEGYHQQFGEAHAEINCLNSVSADDQVRIKDATLYVSLEPCNHFGKTPPCTMAILQAGIQKVVVGSLDPNPMVAGAGVRHLREKGIEVIELKDYQEAGLLNRRFWINQTLQRPYLILKWAQSADGFIGQTGKKIAISNAYSNRLVHQWRSEEDAIWAGYRTVLNDNPRLSTRLLPGRSPQRVIYDREANLDQNLAVFEQSVPLHYYHSRVESSKGIFLNPSDYLSALLKDLYEKQIGSVLVEGGASLILELFQSGFYDEVRVIQSQVQLHQGVSAPTQPHDLNLQESFTLGGDDIQIFTRHQSETCYS
jgi:diaminohydroxyphosphoribosylaminopyrimidine deaminase/5-amino-6-(5-phosphoribosylamino)uracil reductase